MKRFLLLLFLLLCQLSSFSQGYKDSILKYRQHYKEEFIADERSPLKAKDTGYLRFFKPDSKYRVIAKFELNSDTSSFQIPTHSGKKKSYYKYGTAGFVLNKKHFKLEIYRSLDLMKREELKNYLFLPFNDLTNYKETYGGGRYIDLLITDIADYKIIIDFNKAYNPYCAYSEGYNCPIPPKANKLSVRITAGEKNYGKKMAD
jgi:uncharacterized protein